MRIVRKANLAQAFICYARIRPVGFFSFLVFYSSFLMWIFARITNRRRFSSLGDFLRGATPITLSLSGIRARVRPRTNDVSILASTTEPETSAWFQVQRGQVVVDVGAHIGRYSLFAATQASKVIAIEPERSNFEMLVINIKLNKFTNIFPINQAASANPGKVMLNLQDRSNFGGWSVRSKASTNPDRSKRDGLEVRADTLDHILQPFDIINVDWLKIDSEGHEIEILHGASITLSRTRHLIIEVSDVNEKECLNVLRAAGFRLVSVERTGAPASNWLVQPKHL